MPVFGGKGGICAADRLRTKKVTFYTEFNLRKYLILETILVFNACGGVDYECLLS
jgi:hypothetical protein